STTSRSKMGELSMSEKFKCGICDQNEVPSRWGTCNECQEEQPPHTCPYAEEIGGDSETLCTCSKADEYQCAMDI
ncbi:MAG: hypothetical protein ACW96M_05350, partial [Candidatus Thorarchaeota archaeon]